MHVKGIRQNPHKHFSQETVIRGIACIKELFTTASCLHDAISQVQDVRLFKGAKGLDRGNACQEVPIWNG